MAPAGIDNSCKPGVESRGYNFRMLRASPLVLLSLPCLRTGAHVAGGSAGRRDVALRGVIHDHAVGVEAPSEGADGALHALDPAARQAVDAHETARHLGREDDGQRQRRAPVELREVDCLGDIGVGLGPVFSYLVDQPGAATPALSVTSTNVPLPVLW